ncbi:hypothetical protein [Pontibacter pamirensis]|uniref:hypothetical protein n=1 Tax=Pontibacter pamirensis TaxID=2562824 RepID=UPI00138A690D|nr:hypothetical protein [Pontibacter pamirensis]
MEFYVLWINRVPNSQISRFRIPFAPEAHNISEYSAGLTSALNIVGTGHSAEVVDELSIFSLLERFGISVSNEKDLRLVVLGQPIRAVVSKL